MAVVYSRRMNECHYGVMLIRSDEKMSNKENCTTVAWTRSYKVEVIKLCGFCELVVYGMGGVSLLCDL